MNYKLYLTQSVDGGTVSVSTHEGDDLEILWDMVDTSIHVHARLVDEKGALVAKYTSSEYDGAEDMEAE